MHAQIPGYNAIERANKSSLPAAPVIDLADELGKGIESLYTEIAQLGARLEPVATPIGGPTAGGYKDGSSDVPRAVRGTLATTLGEMSRRVDDVRNCVRDLMTRLEV